MMQKEEDRKWYPLYTRSRFEKKAYQHLLEAGFEAYLPLKKAVHQWSDRKKIVEIPLFSSYVFVKVEKSKLRDVLSVYGIVRFIFFNGQPATVRNEEIELIKCLLERGTEIDVMDGKLEVGQQVVIKSGYLKGYSGRVHSFKGKNKLIIEIEGINKTMLVTVEKGWLQ